jgi:transcriptional regulator GlxA family with amidase domain
MERSGLIRAPQYRTRQSPASDRRVGFLLFPGFDLQQLQGPFESFRLAGQAGDLRPIIMSLDGGAVESSCGIAVATRPVTADGLDTLMVVGGVAPAIPRLPELADFVCAASAMLRRIAGIGTGVFVLAQAGLLNGRHAAVGSEFSSQFTDAHPAVRANPRRGFIHDHGLWTAANAASAITVSLALIEEDWGPQVRHQIAPLLSANFVEPQDIAVFSGQEDSAAAESLLRAESARREVQGGREPFETIARRAGFGNAENMRRAFIRLFGQPPQALRRAARLAKSRRKILPFPGKN